MAREVRVGRRKEEERRAGERKEEEKRGKRAEGYGGKGKDCYRRNEERQYSKEAKGMMGRS